MNIGVLAYQGGVEEHFSLLKRVKGIKPFLISYPEQLQELDGLIIPGGESTTLLKLMAKNGMDTAIKKFHQENKALWGTCAGLIILSKEILGEEYQPLGLIDIKVERNAYGSQLDSFITKKTIRAVSSNPVELVFIRAPQIAFLDEGVEALASIDKSVVFAKQGKVMVTAFHPELTNQLAFHQYFSLMAQQL